MSLSAKTLPVALAAAIASLALAGSAAAQTNEGGMPGAPDFQVALGDLLVDIDNEFSTNPPMSGTAEDTLFTETTELSQAAADLAAGSRLGGSRGFTATDLGRALDSLAHRQVLAIGKQASEVASLQAGVIGDRLFALREGTAGLQFAGVLVDDEGRAMPMSFEWFADDAAAGDGSWIPGLGVYANLEGGFGDRNNNVNEAGFDYRTVGFTLGADYRVAEPFIVGVAFTYANSEREFSNNFGELESNSYTGSIYGSATHGDFYLDAVLTVGGADIDSDRNIIYLGVNEKANGETDALDVSFGGTVGYQFRFGGLTVGPVMRGEYRQLDVDGFTETGASGFDLRYDSDEIESATLALGGELLYAISTDFGVVTPQLGLEWEHQFRDDQRNVSTAIVADPTGGSFFIRSTDPDRNYANLNVGVSGAFQGGVSAFINYATLLGNDRIDQHLFKIGVRGEF